MYVTRDQFTVFLRLRKHSTVPGPHPSDKRKEYTRWRGVSDVATNECGLSYRNSAVDSPTSFGTGCDPNRQLNEVASGKLFTPIGEDARA